MFLGNVKMHPVSLGEVARWLGADDRRRLGPGQGLEQEGSPADGEVFRVGLTLARNLHNETI